MVVGFVRHVWGEADDRGSVAVGGESRIFLFDYAGPRSHSSCVGSGMTGSIIGHRCGHFRPEIRTLRWKAVQVGVRRAECTPFRFSGCASRTMLRTWQPRSRRLPIWRRSYPMGQPRDGYAVTGQGDGAG